MYAAKIGFVGIAFDKHYGAHNDVDTEEGKEECNMASFRVCLV